MDPAHRPPSTTLPPGTIIAGFEIEGIAGEGGMGVVYRARQLGLERRVALKLIAANVSGDAELRARFSDEAQLAASIDHPNVVPIYASGETEDGGLYIAMRYVDGTDLRQVIDADGPLEPSRAVAICEQVAKALDAAHARGLVHRDVKPGNVLLDAEHVYLADFGLSKLIGAGGGHTRTGMFVGTPDFMAPEQIRGEATGTATDVYALGCVLHHALVGEVPFPRESETAKIYAHLEDAPPRPSQARPEVPALLDDVIARALAKSPSERFASCGALAAAARAALDGEASGAGTTAPPPSPPETTTSGRGPASWPRGRRIALLIALPTVLVGGLGTAAIVATSGDDSAKAPPAATTAAASGPTIRATIKVGRGPDGVAVADGRVFVANREEGTLSRIDRVTNRETPQRIKLGAEPDGVAAGKGVVWVADGASDQLQRLEGVPDPTPTATVEIGADAQAVSLGRQLVWVANTSDNTVTRVDRATPSVVGSPIGVGSKPAGIFVGTQVWVSNFGDGTVTRIDPSTAQIVGGPIRVGTHPRGIIEAQGAVWVVNSGDDTVTRIDVKTGDHVTVKVGRNPRELTAGHGFIWVTNFDDNTVTRIDPKTSRVAGQAVAVGKAPLGIASGPDSIWVANHFDNTVTRIRP